MKSSSRTLNFISVIILLTCFCTSAEAQSGWFLQQSGTQLGIYSMSFINSNTAYCVGYNGLVLKTTNAGTNWVTQQIGTNYWLKSINFPNPSTGYIIGNTAVVAKTTNSGSNWALYLAGTINIQNSVFFVNGETGFVSTSTGVILKTTNGAANWSSNQVVSGYISSIYFINSSTGYFAGQSNLGGISYQGIIFKTTDGGSSWDTVCHSLNPQQLNCIRFTSVQTGYSGGSYGYLLKTTDEGSTWTLQSAMTNSYLNSIYFQDNNTGYVVGGNGLVSKTTNGGALWSVQQNLATNYTLRSVWFTNIMTGYAAGEYGTIIKTTTGGEPIGIKPITTEVPQNFSLSQNYPNPFNPSTKIKFSIPLLRGVSEGRGVLVRLAIYDILGREIAMLVNERLSPGTYEVEWDGSNYHSGVYFYQLSINSEQLATKKMVLIK